MNQRVREMFLGAGDQFDDDVDDDANNAVVGAV